MEVHIALADFGKDHWSAFAYLETVCVDYGGVPEIKRMRTHYERHPGLVDYLHFSHSKGKDYPTRIKGGREVHDHDDWDCVDDLNREGLVKIKGTGIHPQWEFNVSGVFRRCPVAKTSR